MENNRLEHSLLEQWIILQGKEIASRKEVKGLAVDSSGFNSKIVKLLYGTSLNGLKED